MIKMTLVLETIAKREFNVSMNNQETKKIISTFDPTLTFDATIESRNGETTISRQVKNIEQKRRLLLDNVRHVDSRDFPFEAVLSLEDTVKKNLSSNQPEKMRGTGVRRVSTSKSKSTSSFSNSSQKPSRQQSKAALKITKKNRPPLLKCPTWPNSQYSDGGSDNSLENYPATDGSDSPTVSKIDSPSFYSVSAIDFSAISHLSEEHDKQIAQENAEKASNKHSYISNSTREKLYGKATQKNGGSGRSGRDGQKLQPYDTSNDNGTVFTLTSVPFDNLAGHAYSPPSGDSTNNESKIKSKKCVRSTKASAKSELSAIEKVIRKRYSSTPAVTVSSVPITSLQNEDNTNTVVIEAHNPIPGGDNPGNAEAEEGTKKSTNVPAEKQPLPPEGFKISRYPLKKSPPQESKTPTPEESDRQKTEASLYRLIGELRKQLLRAEEKISEAENQVREWKEIAQRTIQAVEVIKAQIEMNKQQPSATVPVTEPQATVKRIEVRRWSGEAQANEVDGKKVDEQIIQKFLLGKNYVLDNNSGRKRPLPQEYSIFKRQCVAPTDPDISLSNQEEKNKSLLAWLANSEPETDVDYMSFLEVPDKGKIRPPRSSCQDMQKPVGPALDTCVATASPQPLLTQRYVALNHESSIATEPLHQEKPREDYFVVDLDAKIPTKPSLQPQNSFDRFLENFTPVELTYPSNPPSLGSDGEKTPASLPLQSPEIPSPILCQSISDSELHIGQEMADRNYFRPLGDPDNDLTRALDEDFLNQLDDILDF